MRLNGIKARHALVPRLRLLMMRVMSGYEAEDVVHVLLYRREFFGRPFAALVQSVLRGPSSWSVGERELFATRVSLANRCAFCAASHRPIAELAMGKGPVSTALDGPASGGAVDPRALAMLPFLAKLAERPSSVTADDIDTLRRQGLDDGRIEDGIRICALFGVINRIANALDFEVPSVAQLERSAGFLLRFGYRI